MITLTLRTLTRTGVLLRKLPCGVGSGCDSEPELATESDDMMRLFFRMADKLFGMSVWANVGANVTDHILCAEDRIEFLSWLMVVFKNGSRDDTSSAEASP